MTIGKLFQLAPKATTELQGEAHHPNHSDAALCYRRRVRGGLRGGDEAGRVVPGEDEMTDCVSITTWQELPYKCREYRGHASYEGAAAEHKRLHGDEPAKVYEYYDTTFKRLRHFVPIDGASQGLWEGMDAN